MSAKDQVIEAVNQIYSEEYRRGWNAALAATKAAVQRLERPGAPRKDFLSEEELFELLKNGTPKRDVYKGQGGGWYVTYGGGRVAEETVRSLIRRKLIRRTYKDYAGSFQVGPTIDMAATQELRKRDGKDAPLVLVYLDDNGNPVSVEGT